MPQRCRRCDRLFEYAPEGRTCQTERDGVPPCFRTGIRWLDDGPEDDEVVSG